ncbi:MAG: hypothetical protein PHG02_08250 [Oscillospiraceae bacterium]|nr:hypothetical protein [Oscillospiraceae bacterium]
MKKLQKFLPVLAILFAGVTCIGAGYVLLNKGQVNAGYAVVPCVFTVALFSASRNLPKK